MSFKTLNIAKMTGLEHTHDLMDLALAGLLRTFCFAAGRLIGWAFMVLLGLEFISLRSRTSGQERNGAKKDPACVKTKLKQNQETLPAILSCLLPTLSFPGPLILSSCAYQTSLEVKHHKVWHADRIDFEANGF